MTQKFHERFNIPVSTDEARTRFVNRIKNEILSHFWWSVPEGYHNRARSTVLTILGLRDRHVGWGDIGDDFWLNVRVVEAMYGAVPTHHRRNLSSIIENILSLSEVDLGIRWQSGEFLPSGAQLLDNKLVNDVLNCLADPKYEGVRTPFHKGLDHLLKSVSKPALLVDVVTDMYEALEALAKIVTGRDNHLSANAESFISAVKVSEGYKRVLKEYIDYANKMGRHAGEMGQAKPALSRKEVESFVYLTGLFIRLAVIEDRQA